MMDAVEATGGKFKKEIDIVDYCMFGGMLGLSIVVGIWTAYRGGGKDVKQFLQGGRSMSPYPVALSLTGGIISAISILGIDKFKITCIKVS